MAVAIVGVAVFVLVYFEPQKLFLNQTVNEAVPTVAAPAAPASPAPTGSLQQPTPPTAGGQPATLSSGAFQSLEHATTGRAVVLELADGSRILRFEGLRTSNGPNLHVYLSPVPAGPDAGAYGERFIDLGSLKGNIGNQNYPVPAGVDLSKYRSAVIWCVRFHVGFGVAPLAP
jgi:hypothetical protein